MTGWNWVQISAALICLGALYKGTKETVKGLIKVGQFFARLIRSIESNTAAQDELTVSLRGFQKSTTTKLEAIDETLEGHESRLLELEELSAEEKAG